MIWTRCAHQRKPSEPGWRSIPGLTDLQVEKQVLIPQLEIRVDYGRAALYGVQPATVIEQLSRLSNGRVVSRVVDGYRRFDVTMRLPDRLRTTQRLGDLLIETPAGWIPARQLADIKETEGPNQILRENGRRRVVVLANTSGTADMAKIVESIREVTASTKLPEGFYTRLEGTFQAQEEASRTIGILALLSLSLVFAILYNRYRSVLFALIVMGNVPLALIGAVIALWLTGQPLSVASMVGFITLTGIAARNGILKISHYINLALQEGMPFGRDLVVRGSLERLDPGADDGAGGRRRARSAADRCGDARQGNPASRGRHDIRRPDQRDAARYLSHARAVPAVRRKASRTPAARRRRFSRSRSRSLIGRSLLNLSNGE